MSAPAIDLLLRSLVPLHEAPDDAQAWETALQGLARAVPCDQGALVERLGMAANSGFGLTIGTDPAFVREYAQEFHRCDPFAQEDATRHLLRHGRAMSAREVLADRDLGDTEFYSRFLSRYGQLAHGLGGAFAADDGSHAQVWLLRAPGRDFDDGERRCLDLFIAHARAALRLRRRFARVEQERNTALHLLDNYCDPIYLLDEHGRVLLANDAAERTLRDGDLLALRGDQLRGARTPEPDWLALACREVASATRRSGHAETRCVALPPVPGQPRVYALLSVLAPVTVGTLRLALILRDFRQPQPRFDATQLHLLFGFTRTEARVANALLAGRSSEDIAQAWDVRSDTVRAHVKRMLAKTGTRNQGDLQKLLLRLLPNLQSLCRGDEALEH